MDALSIRRTSGRRARGRHRAGELLHHRAECRHPRLGDRFRQQRRPAALQPSGGIATNGTNLVATDPFNNRVLIWNTAPAGNAAPDIVLGQANFTTNNPGTGRDQVNWPISVSIGGGRLFVTDT